MTKLISSSRLSIELNVKEENVNTVMQALEKIGYVFKVSELGKYYITRDQYLEIANNLLLLEPENKVLSRYLAAWDVFNKVSGVSDIRRDLKRAFDTGCYDNLIPIFESEQFKWKKMMERVSFDLGALPSSIYGSIRNYTLRRREKLLLNEHDDYYTDNSTKYDVITNTQQEELLKGLMPLLLNSENPSYFPDTYATILDIKKEFQLSDTIPILRSISKILTMGFKDRYNTLIWTNGYTLCLNREAYYWVVRELPSTNPLIKNWRSQPPLHENSYDDLDKNTFNAELRTLFQKGRYDHLLGQKPEIILDRVLKDLSLERTDENLAKIANSYNHIHNRIKEIFPAKASSDSGYDMSGFPDYELKTRFIPRGKNRAPDYNYDEPGEYNYDDDDDDYDRNPDKILYTPKGQEPDPNLAFRERFAQQHGGKTLFQVLKERDEELARLNQDKDKDQDRDGI